MNSAVFGETIISEKPTIDLINLFFVIWSKNLPLPDQQLCLNSNPRPKTPTDLICSLQGHGPICRPRRKERN